MPSYRLPSISTRTAYTPSGGSSLRGSGDVRLIVGTPMVRPRPAPRSTTARRLYGRPSPRSADARSPCATAVRMSDDEIACPSSVTAGTTSIANPSSRASRRTISTSPARPRPNPWSYPRTSSCIPKRARRPVRRPGTPPPIPHLAPRRYRTSVDHRGMRRLVQLPRRQLADELRGIAQRVRRHGIGRHGIRQPERPDPRPPEAREMRPATQRFPDVASQAAQVRPTTHRGAEAHVGRGEGLELELRHFDAPRSQHHALAAARPPVGSLARPLHRRVRGRPLVVRPAEPGQRRLRPPPVHATPRLRGGHRGAGRIVGGGGRAQPDHAVVRLGPSRRERRQPGGSTQHQHQQPRRERIERPQVTPPVGPDGPTHGFDDVVRRGSLGAPRLRDQRHAGDQPAPSLSPRSKRSICWACSSPRSSSKRSSGVTRNGSSLASWARRKRAALVRPSSDFALSSSLPITLTRTRAYARSPDTSTAVTVTNPTRGSRTLPVRNAATVWRIASATRSGRWLVRRFISEETLARVHDARAVGRLDHAVCLP